jgi:hypothetical protein
MQAVPDGHNQGIYWMLHLGWFQSRDWGYEEKDTLCGPYDCLSTRPLLLSRIDYFVATGSLGEGTFAASMEGL